VNFSAALSTIVTHATAAGTAVTPAITDVANADPVPRGRCIRVWYGGETDAPEFPGSHVLSGELVGEIVNITAFWPVGDAAETLAANRDAQVYALADALRSNLQADSTLGGNVTDLAINHAVNDFVGIGNTAYRILELELILSFNEYTRSP